ncbi:MAG: efflux RND transporter permease subunit, partial [Planctomycetota bacterium]
MNVSGFSVRRPVFTVMATLIVILLGIVSLTRLPVDLMPDITYPTLSVTATYQNASAEEMEELVTRPLEEALSAVPGVEEVTSSSAEGMTNLRISFVWGTDLDAAANDLRDRLDRVSDRLPEEASRPLLRKFDLASFPVLILGASSDLDPVTTRRIIEEQVKYRIERVPGVASLDIWGGQEREIQVDLDLDRVRAYGLPLNPLIARLRAANIDRPAGSLRQGNLDLRVRVPGSYRSLDELAETVVLERENNPVLLRDVATVRDDIEKATRIVRVNGKPGVRLSISKQSGTNTVDVAQAALVEIERINRDIPQIEILPIIDSSEYIQSSIRNVGSAALWGGALAVLVLLFFLRDARSTAVIAVSIPVSIVATFVMIYFGDFTLNLMTLGGLALGIGMLVDNAIVVLENVSRRRGDGLPPLEAATDGAAEVTSAIVASTLTTMVVFLPLIFMRGMAGVMFKQFSFVVAFSLLCSLVTAMTLVPMLASRLLGARASVPDGAGVGDRVFRWSAARFEETELAYKRLLHAALNHRALVILSAALVLGGSGWLATRVGSELMPMADEGEIRVYGEMEVGAALDVMDRTFRTMAEVIRRETPEIESMVSSMGGGGWRASGGHTGQFRISLVPQEERTRSSEAVANHLRAKLSRIPGVSIRT